MSLKEIIEKDDENLNALKELNVQMSFTEWAEVLDRVIFTFMYTAIESEQGIDKALGDSYYLKELRNTFKRLHEF